MKTKVLAILLCSALSVCAFSGCSNEADTEASLNEQVSVSEQDNNTNYKTVKPPADGWTIEELLSVTYVCGKQLSYPINLDSLADGISLDLDNAFYGNEFGNADLRYNDDFLGVCVFRPGSEPTSPPESIKSITISKEDSDIAEQIISNGIKLGDSIATLYECFGEPDELDETGDIKNAKYFDKNDKTKGIFFFINSSNNTIKSILIEG